MNDSSDQCVYLYRDPNSQKIVYVGRGTRPGRAVQHTGGSHNPGLRAIIDEGDYSVELAGPYSSAEAAAAVEAALISALRMPTTQAALGILIDCCAPCSQTSPGCSRMKEIFESVAGFALHLRVYVEVEVGGGGEPGVAEHGLDGFEVDALQEQEAGGAVPQVVQP